MIPLPDHYLCPIMIAVHDHHPYPIMNPVHDQEADGHWTLHNVRICKARWVTGGHGHSWKGSCAAHFFGSVYSVHGLK
jgi:hypothetical protein